MSAEPLRDLRRELERAGVFELTPAATLAKFLAHALAGGALIVACLTLPPLWAALLIPPTALVWVVGVMVGHDATHHAVFRSRKKDDVLRTIAFPFMSGMSGLFWRYKHNYLHHHRPNVIGEDEDLEVLPLAIGSPYHSGSSALNRWIQRHLQRGVLLWLMTTMLPWDLRLRSVRFLIGDAKQRGITREWLADVAAIIGHWVVFLALPAAFVGIARAASVELGLWVVGGLWLGLIGLVGHTGRTLIAEYDDSLHLQFETTRNVRLGPIMSWCFVGLDYQIEHHLFPAVSHFKLKKAAPYVRRFAAAHNLPYHEQPLWECLCDLTAYVDEAWHDPAMKIADGTIVATPDRPARPTWGWPRTWRKRTGAAPGSNVGAARSEDRDARLLET